MKNQRRSKDVPEKKAEKALALFKYLLFAYLLTAALLMLLAFLLYRVGLSEKTASIAIIAVYLLSTFLAGFLAGKRMPSRRFAWGLLEGMAYFLVLAALSLAIGHSLGDLGGSFFPTLLLCAGGGMLGGMLG